MKKENDIKNNDNCAKQAYVPASVKVIQLQTSQRILNDSGSTETGGAFDIIG